jgi:hypothetical protein
MFQIDETKLVSGSCNYLVTIKTSCSSPPHTADEISLLFGDVNGSEVYFLYYLQIFTIYYITIHFFFLFKFCCTNSIICILKFVTLVLIDYYTHLDC